MEKIYIIGPDGTVEDAELVLTKEFQEKENERSKSDKPSRRKADQLGTDNDEPLGTD